MEDFLDYHGENALESSRFRHGKLESVSQKTFRDKLLVEEEEFILGCYRHTRFFYTPKRRLYLQQSITEKGQVFFEIEYGQNDELTCYRVRRDGTRFQLGQPLPKGVTLKTLKETIRNRLHTLIPDLVASAEITEPIYCVTLAYDHEGNDALPPTVAIGLESERRKWHAEHGKDAGDYIWNPAEFQRSEMHFCDSDLDEACDYFNTILAEKSSAAPAIKLLVELSAELNKTSWPATIRRTPDFIIYPVDLEGSDLRRNLKACLPAERLAELKANKLL